MEVRGLEGGGRFAVSAVEVCIGEGGSMEMMPSFSSRCSPSGKEENRKDLLISNLRPKGKSHQYLIFFCWRAESKGLSVHLL